MGLRQSLALSRVQIGEENHAGMGFTFMEAFMNELEVVSTPGQGTKVKMRKKIEMPAAVRRKKRSIR